MRLEHRRIQTGNLKLHVALAGEGPLVVCLHGFPDHWAGWSGLMRHLSRDHRIAAVDLRGYGESDRPRRGYDLTTLAGDVAGVIHTLDDPDPVHVVGHDWGGVVAWALAYDHPDRVKSLSILNAPHPYLFVRQLFTTSQCLRSWYMFFFQIPWLPEWMLGRKGGRGVDRLLRSASASPPATEGGEADPYRPFVEAMCRPGALRAALAYYRTAFWQGPWSVRRYAGKLRLPVRVIWGEEDPALGVGLLEGLERHATDLKVSRIQGAGHWVHWDAEEEVTRRLRCGWQGTW